LDQKLILPPEQYAYCSAAIKDGEFNENLNKLSIWPKSGPFPSVFWINVLSLSKPKRIFLKTKKADQKLCVNWRVSLVQNFTNIPECASEVIGKNNCEISSLEV